VAQGPDSGFERFGWVLDAVARQAFARSNIALFDRGPKQAYAATGTFGLVHLYRRQAVLALPRPTGRGSGCFGVKRVDSCLTVFTEQDVLPPDNHRG